MPANAPWLYDTPDQRVSYTSPQLPTVSNYSTSAKSSMPNPGWSSSMGGGAQPALSGFSSTPQQPMNTGIFSGFTQSMQQQPTQPALGGPLPPGLQVGAGRGMSAMPPGNQTWEGGMGMGMGFPDANADGIDDRLFQTQMQGVQHQAQAQMQKLQDQRMQQYWQTMRQRMQEMQKMQQQQAGAMGDFVPPVGQVGMAWARRGQMMQPAMGQQNIRMNTPLGGGFAR